MTDYLIVVEALAIHDDQIQRYGGSAGIRDRGLLEAALFIFNDKGARIAPGLHGAASGVLPSLALRSQATAK